MADNYLNKKDLMVQIHLSKESYCSYKDKKLHSDYHAIVQDIQEITPELIENIVETLANPKRKSTPKVHLKPEEIVIRVMTNEHVPDDPERKRKARSSDRPVAWTNFPPFKHVTLEDGVVQEVGRSHWKGDLESGSFCVDHGRMTEQLGRMFMLLVERIGRKANFRGYSYIDEMRSHAVMGLCQTGLMFDESKSDNPFSFFTTAVQHSFVRILNLEKRGRDIRDELLRIGGATPSITKQIEHELAGMFPEKPEAPKDES